MWRLRQVKLAGGRHRWSKAQIARIVGLSDHCSVVLGIRAYEKRLAAGVAP